MSLVNARPEFRSLFCSGWFYPPLEKSLPGLATGSSSVTDLPQASPALAIHLEVVPLDSPSFILQREISSYPSLPCSSLSSLAYSPNRGLPSSFLFVLLFCVFFQTPPVKVCPTLSSRFTHSEPLAHFSRTFYPKQMGPPDYCPFSWGLDLDSSLLFLCSFSLDGPKDILAVF